MNDVIELRQQERGQEQAAIWVVRLKEGLSEQQEQEFERWLDQHKSHRTALIEIATAWDELDVVEQLSSSPTTAPKQHQVHLISWKPLAVAASLLICLFIGWSEYRRFTPEAESVATASENLTPVYDTAIGEQSNVTLPDGSTSSLNTNTNLVVKYSNTERRIELTRGEALFEVKPDKTRPFVVVVDDVAVRAIGTAFNVMRDGGHGLEVLVSEGTVAIITPNEKPGLLGLIKLSENRKSEVELSAGEMATIKGTSKNVTKSIKKVDDKKIEERLAWTSGMMVFDGERLDQVIAELSRYTETRIILGDTSLSEINVAGYFKAGDVDALLYALSENFNVTWEQQGQNLIVLRPR